MTIRRRYVSDVAFTPAVKELQQRKGSRRAYARMEEGGSWETQVTPFLHEFLARQRSCFLATANSEGQPYIQHRGGPPGFVRVLDEQTLAFADYAGNRQYITAGNLAENAQAHLFLIDYERRQRIKIWGTARVLEDDTALLERLKPDGYRARSERAIVFTVVAWDSNCPQHIPQRFEAAEVEVLLAERDERIAALELQVARLQRPAGAP
jgi:predicted pyridoxine 5'-phosphate oxidase superfamily flavin-nucleotide-binding protein